MNDKAERVFNGWLALSQAEKIEFAKAVKEYNEAASEKRQLFEKTARDRAMKMQTGPLGQGGCPCCGR